MVDEHKPARVAVWLTNFNNERHIAKALDSVMLQEYEDRHVYVFDNHSTDGAPDTIAKYKRHYGAAMTVVDMPEGLAGIPAMKFAWDYLNDKDHEFSITIGGHDYWQDSKYLEVLVGRHDAEKAIRPDPIALIYTHVLQVNEDDVLVGKFNNILQSGGNMSLPFVPQWVVMGIDCPPFFGLWTEAIRKQVPVRHQCAGFDHLVVAHASCKGQILFEPHAVLVMRAPVPGSNYTKHFSKAALQGGHRDFINQLEWLMVCVDEACSNCGEEKELYRAMLATSMFSQYICLRGYNLAVFPGGPEAFNQDPLAQQAMGTCMQAAMFIRKLVGHS